MGFISRWAVIKDHHVRADDLDSGVVADQTVERWVDAACSAYLDRCAALAYELERSALRLRREIIKLPRGMALGRPERVVVSASATEVRPASFTIGVRLRSLGDDCDLASNAACTIQLQNSQTGEAYALSDEVRNELIGLEQSATRFN